MTNTTMDMKEGLMMRPEKEEALETQLDDSMVQAPSVTYQISGKLPGRIYSENGKQVAYTDQGRKVEFGSQDEGMILCELKYLERYPELAKQIYDASMKEKSIETDKSRHIDNTSQLQSLLTSQQKLLERQSATMQTLES